MKIKQRFIVKTLALLLLLVAVFLYSYLSTHHGKDSSTSYGVVGSGPSTSVVDINVADLLKETNKNRATPLVLDEELNKSAQAKCQDMKDRDYWSHNTPDGIEPWTFIKREGISYKYAGENLGYGFRDSEAVVEGWMRSPGHRANIVNPKYDKVGFATCTSANYIGEGIQVIVVQHFAD